VYSLAGYISIRETDPLCEKINVRACLNLVKAATIPALRKSYIQLIHAFQENLSPN